MQSGSRTTGISCNKIARYEFLMLSFGKALRAKHSDIGDGACLSQNFSLLGSFISHLGTGNITESSYKGQVTNHGGKKHLQSVWNLRL